MRIRERQGEQVDKRACLYTHTPKQPAPEVQPALLLGCKRDLAGQQTRSRFNGPTKFTLVRAAEREGDAYWLLS